MGRHVRGRGGGVRASTMSISPEAGQGPYASPLGTSAAAPGHAPAACCPAGVGSIHSAGQMPSPPARARARPSQVRSWGLRSQQRRCAQRRWLRCVDRARPRHGPIQSAGGSRNTRRLHVGLRHRAMQAGCARAPGAARVD